ncbi:OmpA family protein [Campylobacter ureolyticus]|uniref:OmpA family protein n=1 Tax=Campylobacter ureolyticus TaxID=827 RepID=UPI0022B43906|nr:OmpA family protein [Campylobacter ureolyticus]MCZ6168685.1 OmpA family protein [Campylobacter ureolyticus]
MEVFLGMVVIIFGLTIGVEKSEILLLDSGKPSAIIIQAKDKNTTLNSVNSYMEISNVKAFESKKKTLKKDEVKKRYYTLLKDGVIPPQSYLLYFTDGSNLTESSVKKIDEIRQTIKDRIPCNVSIIGHADTYGSDKINEKVSLDRAQSIAKNFKDLNISKLEIVSFGEKNLLIKTKDGVIEPKNRRVEIQIR